MDDLHISILLEDLDEVSQRLLTLLGRARTVGAPDITSTRIGGAHRLVESAYSSVQVARDDPARRKGEDK